MKRVFIFARKYYFQNLRNHSFQFKNMIKYPLLIGGLASSFGLLYWNKQIDPIHAEGFYYKPIEFIEKIGGNISSLIKENKLNIQDIPSINFSESNPNRYMIDFNIWGRKGDTAKIFDTIFKSFNQSKDKFQGTVLKNKRIDFDNGQAYILSYSLQHSKKVLHGSVSIYYDLKQTEVIKHRIVFEKEEEFSEIEEKMITNVLRNFLKLNYENKPESSQTQQNSNEDEEDGKHFYSKKSLNNEENKQEKKKPSWANKLEKNGCKIFLPESEGDQLDWKYLAGYENQKREIEDTILLYLKHPDIYEKITEQTRMKKESNRPKLVMFEGPPGCGKTTSARIIAKQTNVPLIYMPLEAILSKWYGESETRLASIFDTASKAGKCIIFIDEIDALATSRSNEMHEATRRVLSTLLRKIDSFESQNDVLLICATNRKIDLDPALISRTDLSIIFELPDATTRSMIFKQYAKHLKESELKNLGQKANLMSGRDIADTCKNAERKWASKYIRKETNELLPSYITYDEALTHRMKEINESNLQL